MLFPRVGLFVWTSQCPFGLIDGHVQDGILSKEATSFGNEYHTACCPESGIMFAIEMVEGNETPQELGAPKVLRVWQDCWFVATHVEVVLWCREIPHP